MKTYRPAAEVSTSSMADIAFLLLTFFLVTTVIDNPKGIPILLPELIKNNQPWKSRNLFTIQVNGQNKFLVEGEPAESLNGVRKQIKEFILNNNAVASLSESPEKAVVSLKTDRATTHETFILVLDEIQAAYYEIYGEKVGLTSSEFRKLDLTDPQKRQLHDVAKKGIPMNISIAEPTKAMNK